MQALWLLLDAVALGVLVYWTWMCEERGGRGNWGPFAYREPASRPADPAAGGTAGVPPWRQRAQPGRRG